MMHLEDQHLAAIEAAMVAIRRSQRRRALARSSEPTEGDLAVFDVLDAVEAAEEAGDEVTVSSIAAALDVAQPRASKLVAAAVDAGLLVRVADQADGRRALLRRTEAGRELCGRVHTARRGTFDAAMAGWSARDRATFARLLARFVAGVTQVTQERH
jgi:DNA-binding MarR family transcriptional regulator